MNIYTQTIQRTTQNKQYVYTQTIKKTTQNKQYIYTQTIKRTTQNKQYIYTNNTENDTKQTIHIHTNNTENDTKQTIHTTQKLGRVRAVPRLCGFCPGICLTTEEKARKTLSQGSHTYTYNKNT